ncbi:MAG: hypothetical protein ACOC32_01675 [Nanoarchaeota archaeon]
MANPIASIIAAFIVFIFSYHLLLGIGPHIHEMLEEVPFGRLIQILVPSPEGTIFDFLKAILGSGLFSGVTLYGSLKK